MELDWKDFFFFTEVRLMYKQANAEGVYDARNSQSRT